MKSFLDARFVPIEPGKRSLREDGIERRNGRLGYHVHRLDERVSARTEANDRLRGRQQHDVYHFLHRLHSLDVGWFRVGYIHVVGQQQVRVPVWLRLERTEFLRARLAEHFRQGNDATAPLIYLVHHRKRNEIPRRSVPHIGGKRLLEARRQRAVSFECRSRQHPLELRPTRRCSGGRARLPARGFTLAAAPRSQKEYRRRRGQYVSHHSSYVAHSHTSSDALPILS